MSPSVVVALDPQPVTNFVMFTLLKTSYAVYTLFDSQDSLPPIANHTVPSKPLHISGSTLKLILINLFIIAQLLQLLHISNYSPQTFHCTTKVILIRNVATYICILTLCMCIVYILYILYF